MKNVILVSLLFTSMAFANADTDGVIVNKMAAIEKASGECYKSMQLEFHGADLTVLQFMYPMVLNTEAQLTAEFSKMKSESASCQQYVEKLNTYISAQEELFNSLSPKIEKCVSLSKEADQALTSLADEGKDLSYLLAEFKSLDFANEATCTQVQNEVINFSKK
jgi:hypothetical protein